MGNNFNPSYCSSFSYSNLELNKALRRRKDLATKKRGLEVESSPSLKDSLVDRSRPLSFVKVHCGGSPKRREG